MDRCVYMCTSCSIDLWLCQQCAGNSSTARQGQTDTDATNDTMSEVSGLADLKWAI